MWRTRYPKARVPTPVLAVPEDQTKTLDTNNSKNTTNHTSSNSIDYSDTRLDHFDEFETRRCGTQWWTFHPWASAKPLYDPHQWFHVTLGARYYGRFTRTRFESNLDLGRLAYLHWQSSVAEWKHHILRVTWIVANHRTNLKISFLVLSLVRSFHCQVFLNLVSP